MARLLDIVVDSAHPASIARFWAAALEGYAIAPYDEAELTRLRALGIENPEDDPTVLLEPLVPGAGPRLWFQRVSEPKTVKNRLHLDLVAPDPEAEITRLTSLGARVLDRHDGLTNLADPEGNEFCLTQG
ncbi:VOC family protein [Streptomyces sp. 7-21]|jgi:hypothetical protein|uniref:VOC family protein n=1 Tax=Streptomyces sp. 7-21 TaxID=2802283 RepID=UPI00191CDF63|nr:VOC family protein [Streptomyces sp. 7-21]MBL1066648.1 VOC family protein [Streptomyces sp. 7-21]